MPDDTTTVPARQPNESATEYYDMLRELVEIHESLACRGCNQCNGSRAILRMTALADPASGETPNA